MLRYLTKPQGIKTKNTENLEMEEINAQESKLFKHIS